MDITDTPNPGRRRALAYTAPALVALTQVAFSKGTGSAPPRRIEPVEPRPTLKPRPAPAAPPAVPVAGSPDYTG